MDGKITVNCKMNNNQIMTRKIINDKFMDGKITVVEEFLTLDDITWAKFNFSLTDGRTMKPSNIKPRLDKAFKYIKQKLFLDNISLQFELEDGIHKCLPYCDKLKWFRKNLPVFWKDDDPQLYKLRIVSFSVICNPQCDDKFEPENLSLWDVLTNVGCTSFFKSVTTDMKFKKCVGLKDKDKIPIHLIDKLENVFRVNINVYGDNVRVSDNKFNETFILRIKKGIYTRES